MPIHSRNRGMALKTLNYCLGFSYRGLIWEVAYNSLCINNLAVYRVNWKRNIAFTRNIAGIKMVKSYQK